MSVNITPDPRTMPDGTILILHMRYLDADTGEQRGPVFTYVLLKMGQSWYATGTGRVPQAAGWGAVEKWLDQDGREVVRVEIVTGQRTIWPIQATLGAPIDDTGSDLDTMAQPFEV